MSQWSTVLYAHTTPFMIFSIIQPTQHYDTPPSHITYHLHTSPSHISHRLSSHYISPSHVTLTHLSQVILTLHITLTHLSQVILTLHITLTCHPHTTTHQGAFKRIPGESKWILPVRSGALEWVSSAHCWFGRSLKGVL